MNVPLMLRHRQGETSDLDIVRDFTAEAPVDLEGLAAALGLTVNMVAELAPNASGRIRRELLRDGTERFSIDVNGRHPEGRRRFTLAHEIAHYLLHRDLLGNGVEDNELYRSHLPDPIEREADGLAAELLMPAALVRTAYRAGAKDIASLSAAFAVSDAAMRIRLRQLRLGP